MTTARKLMMAEEFARLPDDGRQYELVDGELVEMMSPGEQHATVMGNVYFEFRNFAYSNDLGRAVVGDPGYILGRNPDIVRGPDFAFTRTERLQGGPALGYTTLIPDLVAEVVSPNDTAAKVERKVPEWLAAGVRLVLVLNPDTRSIVA